MIINYEVKNGLGIISGTSITKGSEWYDTTIDTKIISVFPGMGKSYMYKHQEEYGLSIMDSDSSNFSWIVNAEDPRIREIQSNLINRRMDLKRQARSFNNSTPDYYKRIGAAKELKNVINDIYQYGSKERNPAFPGNYIDHIKACYLDSNIDYVFVSSHVEVRGALRDANIPYTVVIPSEKDYDLYMKRYTERGNNEGFINAMSKNFISFINEIEEVEKDTNVFKLCGDIYLDSLFTKNKE